MRAAGLAVAIAACDDGERVRDDAPARTGSYGESPRVTEALVGARAVDPAVPWARVVAPVDDARTPVATRRSSDMQVVAEERPPVAAIEPRGGLLYLATDGITLRPCEDANEVANSAKSCTSMVPGLTEFPPHGDAQAQAALAQQAAAHLAAFDVHVTTTRPPEYMPYTMSVVGGTPALVGEDGICGRGHLDCGAQQRNLVGIVYSAVESCTPHKTIAHEGGHNFGLEHTDDPDDIMSYTVVYDGSYAFRDACMPVYHQEAGEVASCGLTHRQFCPDGDGEQQNSRAELMAAFGPARDDVTPPVVVDVEPADGSVFTTEDKVLIGARVIEDGGFVGARWTWLGGLPEELPFGHNRCTNDTCTESFGNPMGDPDEAWDYLVLAGPPVGEYLFVFEVMDAHGNETVVDIAFEVVEPMAAGSSDDGSESTGAPTEPEDDESETGDVEHDDESEGGDALPPAFGAASGDASGCAIGRTSSAWLLVLAAAPALRRRRRRGDQPQNSAGAQPPPPLSS